MKSEFTTFDLTKGLKMRLPEEIEDTSTTLFSPFRYRSRKYSGAPVGMPAYVKYFGSQG